MIATVPWRAWALGLATAASLSACGSGGDATPASAVDSAPAALAAAQRLAGGQTTVERADQDALGQPAANLDTRGRSLFEAGNHLFRTPRPGVRGTGPLLNAPSCQGCHVRDGRGQPPLFASSTAPESEPLVSMLLRLSLNASVAPANESWPVSGVIPDPRYGGQLQTQSSWPSTAVPEADARIRYEALEGHYADGTRYVLRQPVLRVRQPGYGPFDPAIAFSARVAPALHGSGLLEAIAEADLLARSDPQDRDGDGISGRPNRVWSAQAGHVNGTPGQAGAFGRFGLKAGKASVLDQTAAAYRNDMGLTSSLAPTEACTEAQAACTAAAALEQANRQEPGYTDLSDLELAQVEFYTRTLAVPAPRGWDDALRQWQPDIAAGRARFEQLGCAGCHTPSQVTGTAAGSVLGDLRGLTELKQPAPPLKALSGQTIWPYTDLLLHDMGGRCTVTRETASGALCASDTGTASTDCDWVQRCTGLAGGTPEFEAQPSEWRTAPLWGVGLAQRVNPHAGFLHDGRARSLEEAVLWHGQDGASEARAAWSRYLHLDAPARQQLLAFLESL